MRPDRWGDAATNLVEDHASTGGYRIDLGRHLRLHAVLERVHLCARLHLVHRAEDRAGRVLTQLVEGDVYHWGSLMAGALLGSLPVAIFYSFFIEHYVPSLTGAVKE